MGVVENFAADQQFICPKDQSNLSKSGETLSCSFGHQFPIVDGVPLLIDEDNSVFTIKGLSQAAAANQATYWHSGSGLRAAYRRMVGRVQNHTVHITALPVEKAVAHVFANNQSARVLVIGAADNDFNDPRVTYSDIYRGKNVSVMFDAHSIPYPDGAFDCVVGIAVLEHVADPWKCAQEMTRVVAPGGFVYSSIPFLQPVHMGAYDFTRFTYLGHRRLWRQFEEVSSGPDMGPATSTAFALEHVFLGLSKRPGIKKFLRLFGIFVTAAIKPLDRLFRGRTGTLDCAAATYFFGRKTDRTISDRELIGLYRS